MSADTVPSGGTWGDMTGPAVALVCGEHPETEAGFQCASCGELLCSRCVTMAGSLFICGRCGDRAAPLMPYEESPRPGGAARVTAQEEDRLQAMGVIAHHVVVPAAIIAMVGALLFFLVDLRSVFLPLGFALKWVGFCFVVATVLIARYGKLSASPERQGCYTLFLGIAMVAVIWVSPWDPTAGPGSALVNTAIVLVVWRFATWVTEALGREGERPDPPKKRLYGVQRLELESWKREQEGSLPEWDAEAFERSRQRPEGKKASKADAHGNTSAAVARLALVAVVGFALAEPILMAGPDWVGVWALAAVVVFLIGTGMVLAASSAIGSLRVVRSQGGQVSEGVVPLRLVVAGVSVVVAIALMLAVPGVTYRGRGELQPKSFQSDSQGPIPEDSLDGEGSGRDPGGEQGETEGQKGEDSRGRPGEQGRSADHRGGQDAPQPGQNQGLPPAATNFLGFFVVLGKFLWIPFVLALLVGALFLLRRLGPFLKELMKGLTGWRLRFLELLAALATRPRRRATRESGPTKLVPADPAFLAGLSPSEAVVRAYLRLLQLFAFLGYPRPERHTPYEFLQGLPLHLGALREPLAGVTELYVRAAYGGDPLAEADRRRAIEALAAVERKAAKMG